MLRADDVAALDETFWRSQRQAVMGAIRDLPTPVPAAPAPVPRALVAHPGWMTWAPALVAATAVLALVTLRPGMLWRPVPAVPTAEMDGLDDPTLLSLSDLAGVSSPRDENSAELVNDDAALPELSDDELDALAQLVGAHGR
jgi:hypothetical protein